MQQPGARSDDVLQRRLGHRPRKPPPPTRHVDHARERRPTRSSRGRTAISTSKPRSWPLVTEDTIFIGDSGRGIVALDRATGCERWVHADRGEISSAILHTRIGEQTALIFLDRLQGVFAIDATDGTLIWNARVDDQPIPMYSGTPVVHDGVVYAPLSSLEIGLAIIPLYGCCTTSGGMAAFDVQTGKKLWFRPTIEEAAQQTGRHWLFVEEYGPSGAPVWGAPLLDAAPRHRLFRDGSELQPAGDRDERCDLRAEERDRREGVGTPIHRRGCVQRRVRRAVPPPELPPAEGARRRLRRAADAGAHRRRTRTADRGTEVGGYLCVESRYRRGRLAQPPRPRRQLGWHPLGIGGERRERIRLRADQRYRSEQRSNARTATWLVRARCGHRRRSSGGTRASAVAPSASASAVCPRRSRRRPTSSSRAASTGFSRSTTRRTATWCGRTTAGSRSPPSMASKPRAVRTTRTDR